MPLLRMRRDRIAELEKENRELHALIERMSNLLTRTAIALKGPPAPLTLFSWHDLPEVAEKLTEQLEDELATERERGRAEMREMAALRLEEAAKSWEDHDRKKYAMLEVAASTIAPIT